MCNREPCAMPITSVEQGHGVYPRLARLPARMPPSLLLSSRGGFLVSFRGNSRRRRTETLLSVTDRLCYVLFPAISEAATELQEQYNPGHCHIPPCAPHTVRVYHWLQSPLLFSKLRDLAIDEGTSAFSDAIRALAMFSRA